MSKILEPVEQKQIVFNGDELIAARAIDGTIYVPVKPIAERLGVDWSSQAKRIKRDTILNRESMVMVITTMTSGATKTQRNKTLCLPLEYLNGWLFGINEQRVKPELKTALLAYKQDVYKVLFEAFVLKKPTIATNADIDAIIAADADLSSVIDVANAMKYCGSRRNQRLSDTTSGYMVGIGSPRALAVGSSRFCSLNSGKG